MDENRFRLRIRYRKVGRLRYLSHLEIVRAEERLIRRTGLPYCVTHGFSPRMKIAFGPALGCGTAGLTEYLDVWLTDYVPADEAFASLSAASADDLRITAAWYVADGDPSLVSLLTVSRYRVDIEPADSSDRPDAPTLEDRIAHAADELERKGTIEVLRKGRPRILEIAGYLVEPAHLETGVCRGDESGDDDRPAVEFTLRSTPQGSLRPDSYADAVLAGAGLRRRSITRTEQFSEQDGLLISPALPSMPRLD